MSVLSLLRLVVVAPNIVWFTRLVALFSSSLVIVIFIFLDIGSTLLCIIFVWLLLKGLVGGLVLFNESLDLLRQP